ncbi:hypothetical protein B0H13DRAFT_1590122, partial [Mycena leptocephala]
SPTITVCTDSHNLQSGCVDLSAVADTCTDFTGYFSFLDKAVSSAQVPPGLVCTDLDCRNGGVNDHDVAVLTGGTWDMSRVQGIAGTQNFNDLTSSISCSPV